MGQVSPHQSDGSIPPSPSLSLSLSLSLSIWADATSGGAPEDRRPAGRPAQPSAGNTTDQLLAEAQALMAEAAGAE